MQNYVYRVSKSTVALSCCLGPQSRIEPSGDDCDHDCVMIKLLYGGPGIKEIAIIIYCQYAIVSIIIQTCTRTFQS